MLSSEDLKVGSTCHGTVRLHNFAQHANGGAACQACHVHSCLSVPRPPQDPTLRVRAHLSLNPEGVRVWQRV